MARAGVNCSVFTVQLATTNSAVRLIKPNVKRDAPLSVRWLAGESGKATQYAMGVADQASKPSTFTREQKRIHNFIENKEQLTWMIEYNGKVVGAVWVDITASVYLSAPGIHIMIGDPSARGKNVGITSMLAVLEYLHHVQGYQAVYSRYRVDNLIAEHMNKKLGFEKRGTSYTDGDTITWQNVQHT